MEKTSIDQTNSEKAKKFIQEKLHAIHEMSMKTLQTTKDNAIKTSHIIADISKKTYDNSKVLGTYVYHETAENAGNAGRFIKKIVKFQSHAQDDEMFQDKCTQLYMMLINENLNNVLFIEKIISNAYAIYAMYYLHDQSVNMSPQFMNYLSKHRKGLRKEEDILKFIKGYEDYCESRR